MDEGLRALEKAAERDPGDLARLSALARHCRRVGWRHAGKTVDEWLAELPAVPESEAPVFWASTGLARELNACGLRAVPGLIAFLEAPPRRCSKQALRVAIHVLTRLEGSARAALPVLIPYCRTEGLQAHAILALTAIDPGAPEVRSLLQAVIATPGHPGRRSAAAGLAGTLETVAGSEDLIQRLLKASDRALLYALPIALSRLTERDRSSARAAYPGWIGEAASPGARALLYYGLPLFRDELRDQGIWLFGLLEGEDDPLARRALLHALAKILGSHPRLLPILRGAAKHTDEATRCAAVRALRELDCDEARAAVAEAAQDSSPLVRSAARGDRARG